MARRAGTRPLSVPQQQATSGPPGTLSVVLRGGAWSVLQQITPLLISLALTPFTIHKLGPDRYGLFVLVNTVVAFLGSFDGGIGQSAGRYFSVYAGADDKAATTRLLCSLMPVLAGLGLLIFAGAYVLAPYLMGALGLPRLLRPDGVYLLRIAAILLTLGFLRGIFNSVLIARQRFALTSNLYIAVYFVYAAMLWYALRSGGGLRAIGLVFVAQGALSTLVIAPAASRYLQRSAVGFVPWFELRQFLSYAWRAQMVGVASLVNLQADALITGAILPVRFVGIYGAGGNLANQLRNVPINALGPIQTVLARIYGREGQAAALLEFERLQRVWVRGSSAWCSAAVGALYFGVSSWLGADYRLSGVVAVVLTIGNTVNLYTGTLTILCQVLGRPGIEARYGFISMALNLGLTVPLALAAGLIGVISATALAQIIGSLLLLRIVRRRLHVPVSSFLSHMPWMAMVATVGVVVGLESTIRAIVPNGALGLVVCAVPGAIGVAFFAAVDVGPTRLWRTVRGASDGLCEDVVLDSGVSQRGREALMRTANGVDHERGDHDHDRQGGPGPAQVTGRQPREALPDNSRLDELIDRAEEGGSG